MSTRTPSSAALPIAYLALRVLIIANLLMGAGILILLFVPKSETKVRFHAAQGLAAHIGILIVSAILSGLGNVTGLASVGSGIFTLVTTIMLVVFAVKAWKGKPVHIEAVDDLTEWLEDKIKPKS